ncbi:MAG: hypothetical protein ACPGO3_10725 [Magnetospiraceae bacterium]
MLTVPWTPALSQEAPGDNIVLEATDQELENKIDLLLQSRLNLNTTRRALPTKSGDQDSVIGVIFNANDSVNTPRIVTMLNAKTVRTKDSGEPLLQVIGILSIADLNMALPKGDALTTFINEWNQQISPVRLYSAEDRLIAANNLYVPDGDGLTADYFLTAFNDTTRAWPLIIKRMKDQGLLGPK